MKDHVEFKEYIEAGFRIIRLHELDNDLICTCEDGEKCDMAGKHPMFSGWQNTPHFDKEQLETHIELGWLNQYGILIDRHLVVDIDPRNGGDKSYTKMCSDLDVDLMELSGHYVKTGGGGYHIFFNIPDGFPLLSKLDKYPGIDFKTNGFVVGAGSRHKSGKYYEVEDGFPQDIQDAPTKLLSLLKRESNHHRITLNNQPIEVDEAELVKMLEFIPADEYETMVSVGMGLHHATNGVGIDLWDNWCQKSDKYDGYGKKQKKWHSFGKSANPRTIGSVYHLAEKYGYIPSITFEASAAIKKEIESDDSENNGVAPEQGSPTAPINFKAIDRLNPPGFVGEVTKYINEQNMRPREWLSVMAALSLVGNVGGLRYKDDLSGVTSNAFFMGVADSGTSKNSVLESSTELYRKLGIADAVNGRIKSEQELMRNLMHHQANFYLIDEFGKFLGKIGKAGQGTAHYLEGITGVLMDAYSKAEGYFLLSGDQKRDYKKDLLRELGSINKRLEADEHKSPAMRTLDIERATKFEQLIDESDNGIKKPFVSISAFTTSIGFNDFFCKETVLDGFLGRCLLFKETDSAPPMNELKNRRDWPDSIVKQFMQIYTGGAFNVMGGKRVEYNGNRKEIKTTDQAKQLLRRVSNFFNDLAEYYKAENGFEALALRGYEAVSKVSLMLAIPEEERTVEYVEYAFAIVMHDLEDKIHLVTHNETAGSKDNNERVEHFKTRVLSKLSNDDVSKSVLLRLLTTGKDKIDNSKAEEFLSHLESGGFIRSYQSKGRGRPGVKYKKV